jgi:tetratricopeptide (TPR) repeat protein
VELAESARRTVGWTLESAEALGFALRAAGRPAEAVPAFRIALAKSDRGTGRTGERELELAETLAAAGERAEALARAKALVSLGRRAKPAPPWLERAQALRKRLRQQEPASAPAG